MSSEKDRYIPGKPARQPYRAPTLIELGSMKVLTKGGNVTSEMDLMAGTKATPGGPM